MGFGGPGTRPKIPCVDQSFARARFSDRLSAVKSGRSVHTISRQCSRQAGSTKGSHIMPSSHLAAGQAPLPVSFRRLVSRGR